MVSCLMGDSTALASAIVRCCLKREICLSGCLSALADLLARTTAAPDGTLYLQRSVAEHDLGEYLPS